MFATGNDRIVRLVLVPTPERGERRVRATVDRSEQPKTIGIVSREAARPATRGNGCEPSKIISQQGAEGRRGACARVA